uniref:Uncharacterized protein n=1 Tax=Chromera velia CCMP2878 TaxID=1169474 RepID=A0A0G4HY12_9ALVE|eukprot:Cvel_1514.t1-p1 / transcript=Cvel_1514.t1 / gene=Cvel_1514 / organism=Chromera_velia_CCMP2878 / gene_product=hypothetical protein / transcript_product=hypothetical protein / location=Cvel_scaffold53:96866-105852(-) / protein_length=76 / sequence_SO=supercontig / SO=protein_coding / is_pseudo=false
MPLSGKGHGRTPCGKLTPEVIDGLLKVVPETAQVPLESMLISRPARSNQRCFDHFVFGACDNGEGDVSALEALWGL